MQLLEDHLKKLREEDGAASGDDNEDDEAAWEGWDVETDSSEESSDGWISVDSDSDSDLEISDSEDEGDKKAKRKGKGKAKDAEEESDDEEGEEKQETAEEAVKRISTLATTKACPLDTRLLLLSSSRLPSRSSRLQTSLSSTTFASKQRTRPSNAAEGVPRSGSSPLSSLRRSLSSPPRTGTSRTRSSPRTTSSARARKRKLITPSVLPRSRRVARVARSMARSRGRRTRPPRAARQTGRRHATSL